MKHHLVEATLATVYPYERTGYYVDKPVEGGWLSFERFKGAAQMELIGNDGKLGYITWQEDGEIMVGTGAANIAVYDEKGRWKSMSVNLRELKESVGGEIVLHLVNTTTRPIAILMDYGVDGETNAGPQALAYGDFVAREIAGFGFDELEYVWNTQIDVDGPRLNLVVTSTYIRVSLIDKVQNCVSCVVQPWINMKDFKAAFKDGVRNKAQAQKLIGKAINIKI